MLKWDGMNFKNERRKKKRKKKWDSRDHLSFDDNTVSIIKKILMR
jgi:hypothetical protein